MSEKMTHLHLHSSYSILDAISKIPDIVRRAAEYGHKSLALTDHGTIAGVPEFYRECKKQGIKPISACEFYMVEDHEQDKIKAKEGKRRGSRNHHLILLAMNQEGWKNIKILTTRSADKFYYAPRIDYSDLEQYSNGLICLTACLKGIVPHNLAEGNYEEAARHAKRFKSIFGDRFYLETQDGGLDIQPTINEAMRHLSNRLDIPTVGCVDAHYIDRNDVEAHEAIWAIRTGDKIDRPAQHEGGSRVYYSTKEFWLKDYEHIFKEMLTTSIVLRPKISTFKYPRSLKVSPSHAVMGIFFLVSHLRGTEPSENGLSLIITPAACLPELLAHPSRILAILKILG